MFPKFLWPTVPSDSGILMRKEAGCGLPGVLGIPEVFKKKAAEWKWQGRSCWNYSCQQLVAALIENVRLDRFINFSSLQVCRWNEQKGLIESCTRTGEGISGWGCPCHNVWEPHVWNERIWKLQVNCRADVRVTKGMLFNISLENQSLWYGY